MFYSLRNTTKGKLQNSLAGGKTSICLVADDCSSMFSLLFDERGSSIRSMITNLFASSTYERSNYRESNVSTLCGFAVLVSLWFSKVIENVGLCLFVTTHPLRLARIFVKDFDVLDGLQSQFVLVAGNSQRGKPRISRSYDLKYGYIESAYIKTMMAHSGNVVYRFTTEVEAILLQYHWEKRYESPQNSNHISFFWILSF